MNYLRRLWPRRVPGWFPPLGHPLAATLAVLLAARGVGLAVHYFGKTLDDEATVAGPMTYFPAAFAYHYAVLIGGFLGLLLVWRLFPRLRTVSVIFGAVVGELAVILGQVDFEMLRLVGRRFNPSVAMTYVAHQAVTVEVMQPVIADRARTIGSLLIIGVAAVIFGIIAGRAMRRDGAGRWSLPWFLVLLVLDGYLWCVPARYTKSQRPLLQPPEVTFARAWLGGDSTPLLPDGVGIARATLLPAESDRWTEERFPLLHRPAGPVPAVVNPPDIIIVAVESLRAPQLGYERVGGRSLTPEFDRLAGESVVFSHFIANGYPSAPGFFAINASALPHRSKTLSAEFSDRSFDSLPVRLKAKGYHRLAIWGGNAAMANELTWARRWYDDVDYKVEGNELEFRESRGDAETFRVLEEHLRRSDEVTPGQPQFIFVATAGTHGPFSAAHQYFSQPEDRAEAAPFANDAKTDRQDNYEHMLGLLDSQIGRLRRFLAGRKRANHTVLLICGDHSVSLGETVDPQIRGYPLNPTQWTSAVLHGPAGLVGAPRVEGFPSSEADIMPTMLALAGDGAPTAAVGTNLLLPSGKEGRIAVAVRDDGYRLDRDGWSLYVSANDPADYFGRRSFSPGPLIHASEAGQPFTADDARRLHAAVQAWSALVEQNRIAPAP